MKKNLLGIVCVCSLFLLSSVARADVVGAGVSHLFGISSAYNDVFFGNYEGVNGDIEGHAAIGGDLTASAYSFGDWRREKHSEGPVLVVGGNAYVSSSTYADGDVYVQGSMNNFDGTPAGWNALTRNNNTGGTVTDPGYVSNMAGNVYIGDKSNLGSSHYDYYKQLEGGIPFDFALAKEQLTNVSSELMALGATAQVQQNGKNFVVDVRGSDGLQTVFIDAALFQLMNDISGSSLSILADADTTVLVNVTNDSNLDILYLTKDLILNGHAGDFDDDGFDGRNVLFNVDGSIDEIYLAEISFQGSILAVDSNFDVQHGHVSGQAFGNNATTSNGGEFHAYYDFDDKHFNNVTPEPASILIFGAGIGGLALTRRFRKKTA